MSEEGREEWPPVGAMIAAIRAHGGHLATRLELDAEGYVRRASAAVGGRRQNYRLDLLRSGFVQRVKGLYRALPSPQTSKDSNP